MVERVRIVCLDNDDRALLIKWRDPVDGHLFWEPPGGGIEQDETPFDAACRELREETGFATSISPYFEVVLRDYHWAGLHYAHREAFYLTRVAHGPHSDGFTAEEQSTFVAYAFVARETFTSLDASIEPRDLALVIGALLLKERLRDDRRSGE